MSAKKEKILVVDDEPDFVSFLRQFLENRDYEVICAADGKEALEKVTNEKPDLVLLDANMPVMNGWDTLKHFRENPASEDIPVIMVTAYAQRQDIAAATAWGVDGYITKPVDFALLLEIVNETLESKYKQR